MKLSFISSVRRIGVVAIFTFAPIAWAEGTKGSAIEIAQQFVKHLSAGEYEEGHKLLNPLFANAMMPSDLDLSWHTQEEQYGKFRALGAPVAEIETEQSSVVRIPVIWERGERPFQVFVNDQGRVDGFSWDWVDPNKKPTPSKPDPSSKRVRLIVGDDPWKLQGLLTLPASGAVRAGVVLVPDAGRNDGDCTYGAHRPFHDLAEGLALQGIATLRYNQRTYQHLESLDPLKVTVRDEIMDDAVAAYRILASREELKGVPVYLLGLGRGGVVLPEIATSIGGVSGIILMGAVARPTEDVLEAQFKYFASLSQEEEGRAINEAELENLARLRKREMDSDELLSGIPVHYWLDLFDRDAEVAVRRAATFPGRILVLHGARDFEADLDDFRLWERGLSGHSGATFKLFDDLNHVFSKGQGLSTPAEYRIPKTMDSRVVDAIVQWCSKGSEPGKAKP